MPDRSVHAPVMLREVLDQLRPQPGGVFLDGCFGGGGHSRAIAEAVSPGGRVIACDRDPLAIARGETASAPQIELHCGNFADAAAEQFGLAATLDGILLDLGLSSDQLADDQRGFSFHSEGPLDLRFDPRDGQSAADLVNHCREADLADLIYRYGEERQSRRIARTIVESRPIGSAKQLADLVWRSTRHPSRPRIHPATRTFQALRIAVNDELGSLERALRDHPGLLRPGGRIAIISFHSLEDRLVKHAFRDDPRLEVVTKKPVTPSEAEVAANPRARSAKLRVAKRRHDDAAVSSPR